MSEQLEIFEEIADQGKRAYNDGTLKRRRGFRSISPAMERAKVARPAPDTPTAPAGPPETIPEPQPAAAVPRVITDPDELLDLIRARRDQLGVTHETIDHLTGWASGYASKLLSPEPLKGLGAQSLNLVLEALALGIARIEFVEDPELADRMRVRWTKRLRPKMRPRRTRSELMGALLDDGSKPMLLSTTETTDETTPELPSAG